jgi:hypothetical protein
MRLPLPVEFPDVEVTLDVAASAVITRCASPLPGTELHVILANGYGLSLIHDRRAAYCGEHTVEAQVAYFPRTTRDLGMFRALNVPGIDTEGYTGLKGWADALWLASTIRTLAALPARD